MNVTKLLFEPRFSTLHEKQFAMSSITNRERGLATIYFRLCTLIMIPPALLWLFGLAGGAESKIILGYLFFHFLISIWMLAGKHSTKVMRFTALGTMFAAQAAWTFAAHVDLSDGRGNAAFGIVWIAYVFTSNLLLPFRAQVHMVMFVFVMLTSGFTLFHYPDNPYGIGSTFIALTVAQNVQIFAHRAFKLGMIAKFKEQSRYVPQQVLLQASRDNCSIQDVFGPKIRFCVCICSDWRNFQEVAGGVSPQLLGSRLSSYYERVSERLNKDFPEGNYFMDWIADELFVVIFGADDTPDPSLVDSGFDFASWLLSHRRRFTRESGYPRGIDVGISAGLASVGIFGPSGAVKATAFGEVPGAARRLQSLAKQFRSEYGDQDRLVLSEAGATMIDADRAHCTRIPLKGPYAMKDLSDEYAYVWPKVHSLHLVESLETEHVAELSA
jgi:class 3 adenylate cyclase